MISLWQAASFMPRRQTHLNRGPDLIMVVAAIIACLLSCTTPYQFPLRVKRKTASKFPSMAAHTNSRYRTLSHLKISAFVKQLIWFFPLKEQSWDLQWKQSNLFLPLSILDQEPKFFRKLEIVTTDIHPVYFSRVIIPFIFLLFPKNFNRWQAIASHLPFHFRYFELNADKY